MKDVSIIIVNWNSKQYIFDCLKSIFEIEDTLRYEIIVIDNASYDGIADVLEEQFPTVKFIQSNKNLGFSKANNLAAQKAKGKYLFFLNPDTKLKTKAIQGLFDLLENTNYGAAGCTLIDEDNNIHHTCARTFPTVWNQICYYFSLNRIFKRSPLFTSHLLSHWSHAESRKIDCISGACLFVRKALFEQLDGFDDNLFMYAEDTDFCYRMKKGKHTIYYLSSETIYHLEGKSSEKVTTNFFSNLMQKEATQYFFTKHYFMPNAFLYRLIVLSGSLYRAFTLYLMFVFRHNAKNKALMKNKIKKNLSQFLWACSLKKQPIAIGSFATAKNQSNLPKASEILSTPADI